jgi:hypothetical protein
LAVVAWKLPHSREALHRLSFHLPDALEENEELVESFLAKVNEFVRSKARLVPERAPIYYYSQRRRARLTWKVLTTTTVAAAVAGLVYILMTKRRMAR